MTRRPRIGVLTSQDARDPIPVSGTPYHMARALARHAGGVAYLGPVPSVVRAAGRIRNRISRSLLDRQYNFVHNRLLAREYAWRFGRRLHGVDVIFAPFGSTQIALLETDLPIVYASDTTFALMRDQYPTFTGLSAANAADGDEIERLALSRATVFATSSEWAAESARRDYGVPADRIHVLPYGANLDAPPADVVAAAKRAVLADDRCRLLLLGVNWEWKGGPIAHDTLLALRASGVDAELTVVGCEPPPELDRTHMRVFARLDKRVAADREQLRQLLLRSHFLIHPTRFDCTPIVVCEASAHGTPALVSQTGGVAAVVSTAVNGALLPFDAGGGEFAARIIALRNDPVAYAALVRSSRELFESRLNWDHWGRRMAEIIDTLA
jgi:glycosyltransferase involved in cell wall biosynthesis